MSTMCGSEVHGFSSSLKSSKPGDANSLSSSNAMRDLDHKSSNAIDEDDDDDELERLIENGELGEEDYLHHKPCNVPVSAKPGNV